MYNSTTRCKAKYIDSETKRGQNEDGIERERDRDLKNNLFNLLLSLKVQTELFTISFLREFTVYKY